jgi:NitT/TauT family transport system ATP-binding protein
MRPPDTEPSQTEDPAATAPLRSGAEVIRARGLSKVFTTGATRTVALTDTDLTVREGEFVSLIGPSGCGKTTLLRLVADLEAPTAGELEIVGASAAEARRTRAYGYVFQARCCTTGARCWRT